MKKSSVASTDTPKARAIITHRFWTRSKTGNPLQGPGKKIDTIQLLTSCRRGGDLSGFELPLYTNTHGRSLLRVEWGSSPNKKVSR